MSKKLFGLILFFLSLFVVIGLTNYVIDPVNYFYPVGFDMAKLMLNGKCAAAATGNCDERDKLTYIINNIQKPVDYAVVGPSLGITIEKEMTNATSFNNYSISGMSLNEFCSTISVLSKRGMLPNKMLISLDHFWFTADRGVFEDKLWFTTSENGNIFINENFRNDLLKSENVFENLKKLFSFTYFKDSINYGMAEGIPPRDRALVPNESYEGFYWKPDGTKVYSKDTREITVEEASELARSYDFDLKSGGEFSETNFATFLKAIQFLKSSGVEVAIMLVPYHPFHWEIVEQNPENYEILFRTEKELNESMQKLNVPIVGSFNYKNYNQEVTNADFYDARHMRQESLERLYDLKIGS